MDIVNLNPMVAPVAGENIVMNSGGGSGSIIYFIVVILVIILLAVIGYFTMKGSSQTTTVTGTTISGEGVEYTEKEARSEEIKHLQEQAYIKYQTEQGNPPELNEDGSLVSDIISGDTPEPEPETIRFTDNGLMVENYIVMLTTLIMVIKHTRTTLWIQILMVLQSHLINRQINAQTEL